MTVRIAQKIGVKNLTKFSKDLGIYDNPDELLSISLGSAETTLLKLTSAYSAFVNGGRLVSPILIDRIQDSEGNTILNNEKSSCVNSSMYIMDAIFYGHDEILNDVEEDSRSYKASFKKFSNYFPNFKFTSIEDGVKETINYFMENENV